MQTNKSWVKFNVMLKFSGDKQLKKNKKSEIKKPKTPHNSHVQIVEIICDSCKW